MKHPSRLITFEELKQGLKEACDSGYVKRSFDLKTNREIYCYTKRCVYEKAWNQFSLMARGLILDSTKIVATPFPKFFNFSEGSNSFPDLPFEVFEKLDGSLIIIHFHNGEWMTSTKGDLFSSQAIWAKKKLQDYDLSLFVPGTTYLAEAIYPENKIVVNYKNSELVMLSAYKEDGTEMNYDELISSGFSVAKRYACSSLFDLVEKTRGLSADYEGFVIRFSDGTRLKIKGEEYMRIHSLISRCTPLAVWEILKDGNIEQMRRELPEEFLTDFDNIVLILKKNYEDIAIKIMSAVGSVKHLSDKELGLSDSLPSSMKKYVFSYRKNNLISARISEQIYREIRPTADILEGYTPSKTIDRLLESAL